jgi:hypothetical protein
MTTYPLPATHIGLLRQEIVELRILQERYERWTRLTDDVKLHRAHMRVASELEQTLFEMENNLMTALETITHEGGNKP